MHKAIMQHKWLLHAAVRRTPTLLGNFQSMSPKPQHVLQARTTWWFGGKWWFLRQHITIEVEGYPAGRHGITTESFQTSKAGIYRCQMQSWSTQNWFAAPEGFMYLPSCYQKAQQLTFSPIYMYFVDQIVLYALLFLIKLGVRILLFLPILNFTGFIPAI